MIHEQQSSGEMPPIKDQLSLTANFIGSQVIDCEAWEDESYSHGGTVDVREAPMLRLANGAAVFCKTRTSFNSDEPNRSIINILHRGIYTELSINGDGTYDFYACHNGDDPYYEYDNLSFQEAVANPDFIKQAAETYKVITEEVPKPHIPFVPRPLLNSIIVIEPSAKENQGQNAALEVGFSESQMHCQDAVLIDGQNSLYGVFDGVGKSKASAVAARLAAVTIQEFMARQAGNTMPQNALDSLVKALYQADSTIRRWGDEGIETGSTTAAVAQIVTDQHGHTLVWASVGDSRLYIKDQDELRQLSKDEGEGNVINNCLGFGLDKVEQCGTVKLNEGSQIVLVTDGITGDYAADILNSDEIIQALNQSVTAQSAAENLISISRKQDDKTAIVIRP